MPYITGLVGQLGIGHVLVGGDTLELAVAPGEFLYLAALELVQLSGVCIQKVQQLSHRRVSHQLVLFSRQHSQSHAPALGGVAGGHGNAVQVQAG